MDKNIIFFTRTSADFLSQRTDVNFIISNLIKNGYIVDIYDSKKMKLMKINSHKIINYSIFKSINFKPLLIILNLISLYTFLNKNKKTYNIVQLNYIQEEYLLLPKSFKNLGEKLILNLYGSDINIRNIVKRIFKKLYKYSDKIIATNQIFLQKANSLVGVDLMNKAQVILLPQQQFGLYTNFNFENKIESKLKLNVPTTKKIISLGTNGLKNEQLNLLIPEVSKLNNIENYFFIINIARNESSNQDIKKFIFKYLKSENCLIIENYLSYEEMSIVRHATDIFINTRKNDQLAASMMESNLSYSYVITGQWLPYGDYTNLIDVKLINDISEVKEMIYEIQNTKIDHIIKTLEKNKINARLKYDYNVIDEWMEFYSKLVIRKC